MKKTLITLLALSGVAIATPTLDDATAISGGSFTAPADWTTSGISATLNFDVAELKTLVVSVNSSNRPVLLSLVDTNNNSRDFRLGETSTATGLYTLGYPGNGYPGNQSFAGWKSFNVNWDNVTGAALTMTAINGNGGTYAVFTFLEGDEYKNYDLSSAGLKWGSSDINKVTYNADIVTDAYAWDGNAVNAVAMNQAVIKASLSIPEPTTATLSLLALAGLAARRRRK